MKKKILHKLSLIFILFISCFSSAQEIDEKEENDLKFQDYFFEALKQRAIYNYSEAIENLENCYQIDSTNLAVEFELSKNYLSEKKYFESEIFIDKALLKEPQNIHLLNLEVEIYKSQHKFEEAIKAQQKLIEINPSNSEKLITLYLQNKNFDKAKELISEIEKNGLGTLKISTYIRYLDRRRNPKNQTERQNSSKNTSISDLKKQYSEKKDYKILKQILKQEFENKDFDSMFLDSKNGIELFPVQPYLYLMNAISAIELTKYTEAIAVLSIGIDFVIDDKNLEAQFYEQFSNAYQGLNNFDEAEKFNLKSKKLREVK